MQFKNSKPEILIINNAPSFFSDLLFDYFNKNQLTFHEVTHKNFEQLILSNKKDYLIIILNSLKNNEANRINSLLLKKRIVDNVFILLLAKKTFRKEDLIKTKPILYPLQVIFEPLPLWLIEEQLYKIFDFLNLKRNFLNNYPELALSQIVQEERFSLYKKANVTLYHEFRNALTPIYAGIQLITLIKKNLNADTNSKIDQVLDAAKEFIYKINKLNLILKDTLINNF